MLARMCYSWPSSAVLETRWGEKVAFTSLQKQSWVFAKIFSCLMKSPEASYWDQPLGQAISAAVSSQITQWLDFHGWSFEGQLRWIFSASLLSWVVALVIPSPSNFSWRAASPKFPQAHPKVSPGGKAGGKASEAERTEEWTRAWREDRRWSPQRVPLTSEKWAMKHRLPLRHFAKFIILCCQFLTWIYDLEQR